MNRLTSNLARLARSFGKSATRAAHGRTMERLETRTLFAAGDLDPTFGRNGVDMAADEGDNFSEQVLDIAATPDDSFALLVTGIRRDRYDPGDRQTVSEAGFGVAHVGNGLGSAGDLTSYHDTPINPTTIAVAADGRVLMAGSAFTFIGFQNYQLAVHRWAGTELGGPSPVMTDLTPYAPPTGHDAVRSSATESLVQPDGRLLVTGVLQTLDVPGPGEPGAPDVTGTYLFLVRCNSDLTLDRTFGGGDGVVVANTNASGSGAPDVFGLDLALTGDGDVVVLGQNPRSRTGEVVSDHVYLFRFNGDGSRDNAFGLNGVARVDIGSTTRDTADAVRVLPGGKILVSGTARTPTSVDIALAQFNPDGTPDLSFGGGDGQVRVTTGPIGETIDTATDLAVLLGGKIVVAGYTGRPSGGENMYAVEPDYALYRFNPDGSTDITFGGGDGKATVDVGTTFGGASTDDTFPVLGVLDDGRTVVAGSTSNYPNGISAARFLGDTTAQEQVLQAETARLSGPTARRDNAGFNGAGYADFTNATGDFVEWTVTEGAAANHRLTFRYANGSSDRPLELRVNGVAVKRVSFPSTGAWNRWATVFADAPLQGGANTVRITSVGSNGPNVDQVGVKRSPRPAPPEPRQVVYGAEYANIVGAQVRRANMGYEGDGYVDFVNASGDSVEWTNVNANAAGTYLVYFRYANGGSDRPLELRVNGAVINPRMSFPGTGSWYDWNNAAAQVPLRAGANTIKLTAVGSNGANIDSLIVSSTVMPPPEQTLQAEDAQLAGPGVGTSNTGYSGRGYADFGTAVGESVEWGVTVAETREYVLEFRYANGGGGNRPLAVKVDGVAAPGSPLAFAPTRTWSTWRGGQVIVRLTAGQHRIRLESLGAGPNVDSVTIRPVLQG